MRICVTYVRCGFIRIISFESDPLTASEYSCQVKVYDVNSKCNFIVRQLHHFTDQFTSIDYLMEVLHSEIQPDLSGDYNMGYFEGQAHSKWWLVSDEDLKAMY